MQRRLRGTAARRGRRIGVKPVFDQIMIDGRQLHRRELADLLIDHMKLVASVGLHYFALQFAKLPQYPAVQSRQSHVRHGVFGRVKIIKIRKLKAQGIAQIAVGLAHLVNALVADHDVVSIILRGDPQAHHIRAVLLDVGFGSLGLFVAALFAFGDLFPLGIDNKPMRQHCLKGGRAVARQRQEQGRLKPAPVLVAAFQIHVGLKGLFLASNFRTPGDDRP